MAKVSNKNIAEAIYESTLGKSDSEQKVLLGNVVHFLARKRLLSRAPKILAALQDVTNQRSGVLSAKVLSSSKLGDSLAQEIKGALSEKYKVQTVILAQEIDEKLLGGIRIEINDEVIDMSLRHNLNKLQDHLLAKI